MLVLVEEVADETLVQETVDVSEAVRHRFFFPLGLLIVGVRFAGSTNCTLWGER